jgi:hypothetical protein
MAICRVKPTTACLEATYKGLLMMPMMPAVDETFHDGRRALGEPHRTHKGSRGIEDAFAVDGHHAAPPFSGKIQQWVCVADARAVHKDVELTKACQGGFDASDLGCVAHIQRNGQAALATEFGGESVDAFRIGVDDRNRGALCVCTADDDLADATRAASDDHGPIAESAHGNALRSREFMEVSNRHATLASHAGVPVGQQLRACVRIDDRCVCRGRFLGLGRCIATSQVVHFAGEMECNRVASHLLSISSCWRPRHEEPNLSYMDNVGDGRRRFGRGRG